ncbi:vegetative cell wall protein gp1-like [Malus sylvestris]|uniref:vegetative cell wall protein gp1-like n=1 Tax=Malus sylvestris TaxID=3752 RepID=UPI0010AB183F|nr:vegetative cell wall protein gp1-like [Malus domestica]XP_050147470.1 vegetative cell wall protein gp1-like [Malus sylvestris]
MDVPFPISPGPTPPPPPSLPIIFPPSDPIPSTAPHDSLPPPTVPPAPPSMPSYTPSPSLRVSSCSHAPPPYLKDYVCSQVILPPHPSSFSPPGFVKALLIYVDDIVITGNDVGAIASLKLFLHNHFRIKDLGDLKYFLGIEVSQSKHGIYISQRKYALEILKDYGFLGARPIAFPMDDTKLSDKGELSRILKSIGV